MAKRFNVTKTPEMQETPETPETPEIIELSKQETPETPETPEMQETPEQEDNTPLGIAKRSIQAEIAKIEEEIAELPLKKEQIKKLKQALKRL